MQQMKDFCPAQYYVQLFFLTKPKREKLSLILLDQVITQLFSWNAITDVTKVEQQSSHQNYPTQQIKEILQESKLSFLDMVSQLTFKKLGQLIASCGRTRIDVYSWFNKGCFGYWEFGIGNVLFASHSAKSLPDSWMGEECECGPVELCLMNMTKKQWTSVPSIV